MHLWPAPISLAFPADAAPIHGIRPNRWLLAGIALAGALFFAWTAINAMRSGAIDVERNFLGFISLSVISSDDQPIQFWFAVIGHWIASAACLIGLVFLLK